MHGRQELLQKMGLARAASPLYFVKIVIVLSLTDRLAVSEIEKESNYRTKIIDLLQF